jgi:hypothetical protein
MQPDDFGDEGAQARDEAMERADRHANQEWRRVAALAIRRVAALGVPFTADEVWAVLERTGFSTHDRRALGPLMKAAVSDGLIQPTGAFRPTRRPTNHCRPLRVYEPVGGVHA